MTNGFCLRVCSCFGILQLRRRRSSSLACVSAGAHHAVAVFVVVVANRTIAARSLGFSGKPRFVLIFCGGEIGRTESDLSVTSWLISSVKPRGLPDEISAIFSQVQPETKLCLQRCYEEGS